MEYVKRTKSGSLETFYDNRFGRLFSVCGRGRASLVRWRTKTFRLQINSETYCLLTACCLLKTYFRLHFVRKSFRYSYVCLAFGIVHETIPHTHTHKWSWVHSFSFPSFKIQNFSWVNRQYDHFDQYSTLLLSVKWRCMWELAMLPSSPPPPLHYHDHIVLHENSISRVQVSIWIFYSLFFIFLSLLSGSALLAH